MQHRNLTEASRGSVKFDYGMPVIQLKSARDPDIDNSIMDKNDSLIQLKTGNDTDSSFSHFDLETPKYKKETTINPEQFNIPKLNLKPPNDLILSSKNLSINLNSNWDRHAFVNETGVSANQDLNYSNYKFTDYNKPNIVTNNFKFDHGTINNLLTDQLKIQNFKDNNNSNSSYYNYSHLPKFNKNNFTEKTRDNYEFNQFFSQNYSLTSNATINNDNLVHNKNTAAAIDDSHNSKKYKFSWDCKIEKDNNISSQNEEWMAYSLEVQDYLSLKYEEFLKGKTDPINLIFPQNIYMIDFTNNSQYLISNKNKIRKIKIEENFPLKQQVKDHLYQGKSIILN